MDETLSQSSGNIADLHPSYRRSLEYIRVSRDAYDGSKKWIVPSNDCVLNETLARDYLIQGEAEAYEDWKRRLRMSVYENQYKSAIEGFVGILSNYMPIALPSHLEKSHNIDRKGTDFRTFLQSCDRAAFIDGWCGVLVEFPRMGAPDPTASPYLTLVSRSDIIDLQWDIDMTLVEVKIARTVERSGKRINQLWVLRPGTVEIWEEADKDWILQEELPIVSQGERLKIIPFSIYPVGNDEPFEIDPPFLDLALDNFALYNQLSRHDWNLYKTTIVVPVRKGVLRGGLGNDKTPDIKLNNHAVDVPEDGDFFFAESTGNAANARFQRIEDLRGTILTRTLKFVDKTSQMTEDEVLLRTNQTRSAIAQLANAKVSAVGEIATNWCLWTGEEGEFGICFDPSVLQMPISAAEKRELREDVKAGLLSRENYWKIVAARGGLPRELSWEDVVREGNDVVQ